MKKEKTTIDTLPGARVGEQAAAYEIDSKRKLTYYDYMQLPDEPGCRYELLDGMLVKDSSPATMHQVAAAGLLRILFAYFDEIDPSGLVLFAPTDVTLGNHTVVQPDILYMRGDQTQQVLPARIDGSPALVVEVLSPSTSRRDRVQKLRIYRQSGIPHYWLVNPEEQTMECFALREGVYVLAAIGEGDDVVEPPGFPRLAVALNKLWRV